jgi:hypothetical protein
MRKKQLNILIFGIISILLLSGIFVWIDFLATNNYIREAFDSNSPEYSHTVNMPLTTTTSCQNFCGPSARCAITGQQCTSDIDCPGCQPQNSKDTKPAKTVPANDDAGKLSFNQTPQYSPLTSDFGTKSRLITHNKFSKTPGLSINNSWIDDFNESQKEFDKQYKPRGMTNEPDYQVRYSLSGDFKDEGPFASNAYLS